MDSAFPAGLRNLTSFIVNWKGKKKTNNQSGKKVDYTYETVSNATAGDSSEVRI